MAVPLIPQSPHISAMTMKEIYIRLRSKTDLDSIILMKKSLPEIVFQIPVRAKILWNII